MSRMSPSGASIVIKVGFNTNAKDGWPPFEFEHIWLTKVHDVTFTVENIPFYLRNMSLKDEIVVKMKDNYYAEEWITSKRSINSTLWVMELKKNSFRRKIDQIREHNILVEEGVPNGYFSVSIPSKTALDVYDKIIAQYIHRNNLSVAYGTLRVSG